MMTDKMFGMSCSMCVFWKVLFCVFLLNFPTNVIGRLQGELMRFTLNDFSFFVPRDVKTYPKSIEDRCNSHLSASEFRPRTNMEAASLMMAIKHLPFEGRVSMPTQYDGMGARKWTGTHQASSCLLPPTTQQTTSAYEQMCTSFDSQNHEMRLSEIDCHETELMFVCTTYPDLSHVPVLKKPIIFAQTTAAGAEVIQFPEIPDLDSPPTTHLIPSDSPDISPPTISVTTRCEELDAVIKKYFNDTSESVTDETTSERIEEATNTYSDVTATHLNDVTITHIDDVTTTTYNDATTTHLDDVTTTHIDNVTTTYNDVTTTHLDDVTTTHLDNVTTTHLDDVTTTHHESATTTHIDEATTTHLDDVTTTHIDDVTTTTYNDVTTTHLDDVTTTHLDDVTTTHLDDVTTTHIDDTTTTHIDDTTTIHIDDTTTSHIVDTTTTHIDDVTTTHLDDVMTTHLDDTTTTHLDDTTTTHIDDTTTTHIDDVTTTHLVRVWIPESPESHSDGAQGNGHHTTTDLPLTSTNPLRTVSDKETTITTKPETATNQPEVDPTSTSTESQLCPCRCLSVKLLSEIKNMTLEVIEELTTSIQKNLTVDTSSLSSTIRLKTSAYDTRPTSRITGIIGIVSLVLVFGSIAIMDMAHLLTHVLCSR